jgi:hypothetical protein
MKKAIVISFCLLVLSISHGSSVVPPPKVNAKNVFIPIGQTGNKISVFDLSTISAPDLQKLTGRKMGLLEKISFKMAQRKLRHGINEDGTFNQKSVARFFRDCETGFHIGGFALGFFLGLIGVLIAYLIKDDCKQNRVKWSWIGLLALLAILLVAAAV